MILLAAVLALSFAMPANSVEAKGRSPEKIEDALDRISGSPPDPGKGLGLRPAAPGAYPLVELPGEGDALEASVDLSGKLPPVGNQGAQGSCVGWATSYYYKSWVEKQEHTSWDLSNSWYQFSPAFVYNQINGGSDRGAYFQDAFNLIETKGDVDIAEMPYSQYDYTTQPTAAQLDAAEPYRIPSDWAHFWDQQYLGPYSPGNPIEDVKTWLDDGKILVMGIPVYRDFPSYAGNPSSLYYDYNGSSSLAGGHAVCICGYDDNINPGGSDADHQGGFKMVNSWGSGWNSPYGGYVYLSYDFVKRYVWEAWTMGNLSPDSPSLDSLSANSGSVGATIALFGDNFGTERRAAKVNFNGVQAPVLSWGNDRVDALVPSGATSGPLAILDWEGTASNSINFNVGEPPADQPTVTSVSPDSGVNDGSINVSVYGTNFATGCQVELTKSGQSAIEATGENRVSSERVDCTLGLNGAAEGAWNVTVTNPNALSGTLAAGFTVEGTPSGDTYEPNDTLNAAYGPLSPNTDYASYIYTQYDEDWYKINVPEGCTELTSRLTSIPGSCDYDFEIYDSEGSYVGGSYNWYSADELIELYYPSPGTYYLYVYPWNGYSDSDTYLLNFTMQVHTPSPTISSISPTSGEVGSEVTIKGSDFGGGGCTSVVTFNGRKASDYSRWNDTEIVCKVPTTTSGPVRVTTPNGTSNSIDFTITEPAPPDNTPSGEDIRVIPNADITIVFDEVISSGSTTTENRDDPVIEGYEVSTGTCLDISTTAEFSGKVWVTFSYEGCGLTEEQEENVVVLHEEGDGWVDRTASCDMDANTVTAEVDGFSRFVLALPEVTYPVWYLAEGSTSWGFFCYITIANPNAEGVTAKVTYMTEEGPVERAGIALPPQSQATLDPSADIGSKDFSTKVECLEGKGIAVDRTMYWAGEGAPSSDGHCSVGANSPATTWFLPEGSSNWGFECWLLIQNPNDAEATVTVTYMIEGDEPVDVVKQVPAKSRRTYNMAEDIGAKDASIKVSSDLPVIPERAMYRNNRREGHDSIGTTAPALNYFLAEGTTAWGFTTYVMVQNPNEGEATVTVTYMTADGPVAQEPFVMPAFSRETIRVNDVLPEKDCSVKVSADVPIIAERAMYWGEGSILGEVCHDSIGLASAHRVFYLPDGETSYGKETWTLVQNPNDTEVEIEVSYMTPSGEGNAVFTDTIPACSRKSYNMIDHLPDSRAAVMVKSKTPGKHIMVERAMYWNGRGAGTDTIGGFSG